MCVDFFFVSLLSLNINLTLTETVSLSQMEESHSLILLKAARSKSAHNITWKVHIFCSAAHRNVLIACSFSLEIIVIRKNFNENDIYTLTHIPLRFFKWMIRLNAAKWSKKKWAKYLYRPIFLLHFIFLLFGLFHNSLDSIRIKNI